MAETLALAERLLEDIGRLRRRSRGLAGPPLDDPELTSAQIELVRHVRRNDGCTVSEAADALGLAPNTVSTLVGALHRRGHLVRTPHPDDRRSVRLSLTPSTRERVERWRDHRSVLVAKALQRLPDEDRGALRRALGSLETLIEALQEEPEETR